MFFSFYSIFCLGSTKNEGHICNLHAKTQLLMYDKGGLSTKKFSSPEGRWRTVRKPGLDENSGFEWKNLYFQYQWPKRNSFQGYSFLILKKVLLWDSLLLHAVFLVPKTLPWVEFHSHSLKYLMHLPGIVILSQQKMVCMMSFDLESRGWWPQ